MTDFPGHLGYHLHKPMPRTRIKFCGMTRAEDAVAAAELGADGIGLILHGESRRRITVEQAKEILAVLPPFVTPVGLFVDAPAELIIKITTELHLRHVQLHGREQPGILAQLPGRSIIKAVPVTASTLVNDLKPWTSTSRLKGLLLETANTKQAGGSGIENDWAAIRAAKDAGHFKYLPPLIAAGGLTPLNVAEVVRTLRPWAVDVSTGIESSPGVKSREKMAAFVQAVQNADS